MSSNYGPWCFVGNDCGSPYIGNGHSCAGQQFAWLAPVVPSFYTGPAQTVLYYGIATLATP